MAAKSKEFFIHLDFDSIVSIPEDLQEKFLSDIKRGEILLYVYIEQGDGVSVGIDLYPDQFKTGKLVLTQIKSNEFKLECHGVVPKKIDPSCDKDLVAALKQGDLVVIPSSLSNSDADGVDLDTANARIRGRCTLTE